MIVAAIGGEIHHGKTTLAEALTEVGEPYSVHLETSEPITYLANSFNAVLRGMDISRLAPVPLANAILERLVPQFSDLAGRELTATDIQIDDFDVAVNTDRYNRLFRYYRRLLAQPDLYHDVIDTDNKDTYRDLLQWVGIYTLHRLNDKALWFKELQRRYSAMPEIGFAALTAVRSPEEAKFVREQEATLLKVVRPATESDTSDITEQGLAVIRFDSIVHNDADVSALQTCAADLYGDLESDKLQPEYRASAYA